MRRRGWNLIGVAIVVVALGISTPQSSAALGGDHFGAPLHPNFPHVHGDGHTLTTGEPPANLASHDPASRDVAAGLSVPLSQAGAREAAAGIVLSFALAALVIELSRRPRRFQPVLIGRLVSPPTHRHGGSPDRLSALEYERWRYAVQKPEPAGSARRSVS